MSNETQAYTYFTIPDGMSHLVQEAAARWLRFSFSLETAGAVAVGLRDDIAPALSGKGILLPNDGRWLRFVVKPGTKVWLISNTLDRVRTIIEPLSLLEVIAHAVTSIVNRGNHR